MGGPGSGKTTLARGVSRLTDVGYIELNLVARPSQDPGIPMKSDRELSEEVKLIILDNPWHVHRLVRSVDF